MQTDPQAAILAIIGILIGGVLKGATGAGAPIIAVPMLTIAFDVQAAVTIMTVPAVLSNVWQGWQYRAHLLPREFVLPFNLSGFLGAGLGTILLVSLSPGILSICISVSVLAFIAFRLFRPNWKLAYPIARQLAAPAGFAGGTLQGAIGISAPVSISFLNAMGLARQNFIANISVFFLVMALSQIPLAIWFGIMTWERALLGVGAFFLMIAAMPLGAFLGRYIPDRVFNWVILLLLGVIALRLFLRPLTG